MDQTNAVLEKNESRVIETRMASLYLKDSETCGTGIFTHEKINLGEYVMKFSGIIYERNNCPDFSHAIQLDTNKWILNVGGIDSFNNHSCDPSTGLSQVNGEMYLKALRTIEKDEEITFDYSTSMNNEPWGLEQCFCGSRNCRGNIKNFKDIPEDVRNHYISLGVVPRHVLEN